MAKKAEVQVVRQPLTPEQQDLKNRFSIQAMAACGATPEAMADYLGLKLSELKKKYGEEIKTGADRLRMDFEIQLAARAKGGSERALLAWLKQYAGWTEVTRREITGANGEPITIRNLDAPSLDQLIIALRQAEAAERRAQGSRGAAIGGGSGRVIDLDPVSGSTD